MRQFNRWVTILAAFVTMCVPHRALAQSPDTILEWNRILLTSLGPPGALEPTVFFTRPLAMVHVAIYDALNSFDRVYTPYVDSVSVEPGASREAAVAQAARDTLAGMFPSQTSVYDAALTAQLSRIPAAAAASGSRSALRLPERSSTGARMTAGIGRIPPTCCRISRDIGSRSLRRTRRPGSSTIPTSRRS
jgi:hypothetical protein